MFRAIHSWRFIGDHSDHAGDTNKQNTKLIFTWFAPDLSAFSRGRNSTITTSTIPQDGRIQEASRRNH
jgi:hypothetical protein